jgi:hypothetical protein
MNKLLFSVFIFLSLVLQASAFSDSEFDPGIRDIKDLPREVKYENGLFYIYDSFFLDTLGKPKLLCASKNLPNILLKNPKSLAELCTYQNSSVKVIDYNFYRYHWKKLMPYYRVNDYYFTSEYHSSDSTFLQSESKPEKGPAKKAIWLIIIIQLILFASALAVLSSYLAYLNEKNSLKLGIWSMVIILIATSLTLLFVGRADCNFEAWLLALLIIIVPLVLKVGLQKIKKEKLTPEKEKMQATVELSFATLLAVELLIFSLTFFMGLRNTFILLNKSVFLTMLSTFVISLIVHHFKSKHAKKQS